VGLQPRAGADKAVLSLQPASSFPDVGAASLGPLLRDTTAAQGVILRASLFSALIGASLPRSQGPPDCFRYLTQNLPIFHIQLYDKGAFIALPRIAADTAGELITVIIDLYERSTTAFAATKHDFCIAPSSIVFSIAFPSGPLLR
jgi:hypothetical protein